MSETDDDRADPPDRVQHDVVRVRVTSGPHAGSSVDWQHPGSYLIGRGEHAQLALPHDLTAGVEHCRLEVREHGCILEDLGSRQGTHVNGSPIKRSLVTSGDEIQIGLSTLVVTILTSEEPDATVLRRSRFTDRTVLTTDKPGTAGPQRVLEIPGYSILRKLGAGGMGVVYEARRLLQGDRVAVKTIIPAPGAGHSAMLLFQREMELLAQLDHPRIVRFIESGEHAGQIYLIMEYVETVDLAAIVKPLQRTRQIQIYCAIVCQVLEALDYAHRKKLVHRDIKPHNLLVSRSGSKVKVKLADFGLAKNFEQAGLSQLTADNEIRGTPAFMPWEQLQDSRYAKPTVDLYAVGATLFYYLVGRSPGHSSARTGPLSGLEGLPADLARALNRALAAEPQERFPAAAEMREVLLPFTR